MAMASSSRRVLSLCRQFQNTCAISSIVNAQKRVGNLANYQTHRFRSNWGNSSLLVLTGNTLFSPLDQCRTVHTTVSKRGLDEFFDFTENWGESTVKSGAPWTPKQLRTKSNEDLHKLWYVLLKEKNMLLTIEQEAKRQRVQMPSPERLKKVERSLKRLDGVVTERETALRLLQTGQEKGRPGGWRRNVFGQVYWHGFREHPIPWYMNKRFKRRKFYTPAFVEPYVRLRMEKNLRAKGRKARLEKETLTRLKKEFPEMASAQ